MSDQHANLSGSYSPKSTNLVGRIGATGYPSGTRDYNKLINKPSINGKELIGNIDFGDLGDDGISSTDIDTIVDDVFGE